MAIDVPAFPWASRGCQVDDVVPRTAAVWREIRQTRSLFSYLLFLIMMYREVELLVRYCTCKTFHFERIMQHCTFFLCIAPDCTFSDKQAISSCFFIQRHDAIIRISAISFVRFVLNKIYLVKKDFL